MEQHLGVPPGTRTTAHAGPPVRPAAPGAPSRRVGLVSAELTEPGLSRLASSAAASLAAGAGCLVVALDARGPLSPAATAVLLGVHLLAASHGAEVTLVTSDPELRRALLGLPVPGGARVAASAPVALRAAAGVLAPTPRRVL